MTVQDMAALYTSADACERLARLAERDAMYFANRGDDEDADQQLMRAARLWAKAAKLREQADGGEES